MGYSARSLYIPIRWSCLAKPLPGWCSGKQRLFARGGLLMIIAGWLTLCSPARAALITNGSFESDTEFDFSPNGWTTTGQLNNLPSATPRSNIQTRVNANYASQGLVGLQLNGGGLAPGGGIYQDFATVIGTLYALTFDFGKDAAGAGTASLTVSVRNGSGILGTVLLSPAAINDSTSDGFSTYTYQFTALSAVSNLRFVDSTSGAGTSFDGKLDNISVIAIPEPSTFALAAFCLLGTLGIRRGKPSLR